MHRGGINPYRYVANDPINKRDPLGLLLFDALFLRNRLNRSADHSGSLTQQEKDDLMLWVGTVIGAASPETLSPLLAVASALSDPNTPKAAILLAIKKYNLEEYGKMVDNPSYVPQTIDPTLAAEHPLIALKQLKYYKTKQKSCQ